LPVIDELSNEYADQVTFVAAAWKGTFDATAARAQELLPSGNVQWGLDETEAIFSAYGVPYQPVTVMIGSDKTIVDSWAGVLGEDELRTKMDTLAAS
jgi:hypothetical protein